MNTITFRALEAFPAQLEAHYAGIPPRSSTGHSRPGTGVPSEPLTAIEQVCHVRYIEIDGYHARFQRTLTEVIPIPHSIDTMALAKERSYGSSSAEAAFATFRAA